MSRHDLTLCRTFATLLPHLDNVAGGHVGSRMKGNRSMNHPQATTLSSIYTLLVLIT